MARLSKHELTDGSFERAPAVGVGRPHVVVDWRGRPKTHDSVRRRTVDRDA
jgi:hypothetical protein